MRHGKAEDADGLPPVKDGSEVFPHVNRRALPIFKCIDYIIGNVLGNCNRGWAGKPAVIGKNMLDAPFWLCYN